MHATYPQRQVLFVEFRFTVQLNWKVYITTGKFRSGKMYKCPNEQIPPVALKFSHRYYLFPKTCPHLDPINSEPGYKLRLAELHITGHRRTLLHWRFMAVFIMLRGPGISPPENDFYWNIFGRYRGLFLSEGCDYFVGKQNKNTCESSFKQCVLEKICHGIQLCYIVEILAL